MGLDMYLTKKEYIAEEKKTFEIEIGYWRKANAIHAWFVKNVQEGIDNCGMYEVSEEKLIELLVMVRMVQKNPELAKDLLPTQAGFFFGGIEYDKYYFGDLKETDEIINKALDAIRGGASVYYQSSW